MKVNRSQIARNHRGWRIGEGHGRARYTDETIREARRLHEEEGMGYKRIGARLNAPARTVADWCTYATRYSA